MTGPLFHALTLPASHGRDGGWQASAACRDTDPALFFPELGERAEPAIAICAGCPVVEPCLQYALDYPEHDGVWGGTSPEQRQQMRRRAGRVASRNRRQPMPCGTEAAYKRHQRADEPACRPCKDAHALRKAIQRARAA